MYYLNVEAGNCV